MGGRGGEGTSPGQEVARQHGAPKGRDRGRGGLAQPRSLLLRSPPQGMVGGSGRSLFFLSPFFSPFLSFFQQRFIGHLLVPDIVLGPGETVIHKTDKVPACM